MSDTSGLPNSDSEGVPAEDRPERFEDGQSTQGGERPDDAQAAEPAETEAGQGGATAPEGAEDVTTAETTGSESAEPPPADFDPAQQPSNPDLVKNTEPPD
ncbi:MAG TPA: hypothetical protein VIG28_01365 [Leifsonia sp.]|jgi:hypothetical protein